MVTIAETLTGIAGLITILTVGLIWASKANKSGRYSADKARTSDSWKNQHVTKVARTRIRRAQAA